MTVCLCGENTQVKYKLKENVYYCKSCNLFFAPEAKFKMDFQSMLNEDLRVKGLKELRMANFEKIIDNLKKHKSDNISGLEIGSSYGWFLEKAQQNNIKCVGIEPEHSMWEISVKKGFDVLEGFFPEVLPNDFNKVDFIIFNDVLEHIPDVNSVLDTCYRYLKEDGVIIINIPQSSGVFYKLAQLFYFFRIKTFLNRLWQFDFHSPHFYYFNKKSLTKVLQKNNFYVLDYHPLETIREESVSQRINSDYSSSHYSKLLVPLVKLIIPVLSKLNEDIGCFYCKKIK
jgi:SAM-dependent methyltransferase